MLISRGTWLAGHCLLAVLALAVVTVSTSLFRPHQAFTTTALLYLIIVVVLSLNGSFLSAAIVSLIAVFCLEYFCNPPLYTLGLEDPLEAIALLAFLTTALVVTRLVSRMRTSLQDLQASIVERTRAEEAAQRQAALLDLTHDTVFVRDPHDVVTFWNRGGQELYGWSAQEAVGSLAHELLKTEFPAPRDQITDELDRTERWEGELTNAKRDGSKSHCGESLVPAARQPGAAARNARDQQRHHIAQAGSGRSRARAGRAHARCPRHDAWRAGRIHYS
jgi:PAS domain S-box-containing protein